MYFKIFVNPSKFRLNAIIFAAFNLIFRPVFCQEINEFFRLKNSDNLFITTGFTEVNGKSYGIGISVDSVNQSFFNIFNFGSKKKIEIEYSMALENSYNYIQFTPPKIDKLNRLFHAFSMENSNIGRNGKFIIFDSKSGLLIDSVYLSPHKTGFSSAVQKPDSTFLLFGTSTEFDPNGDFYLMHVGKNGEFISDTTYGHTAFEERGYAIAATPDGGYVFTGMRRTTLNSVIKFRSKIAVYKIDAKGAVEWSNLYGGDLYNVPYQIKVAEDSNIYIVGFGSTTEITENSFDNSPSILKLSRMGNIIWDALLTLPPEDSIHYQRGESSNILLIENKGLLFFVVIMNFFLIEFLFQPIPLLS